jgi:hypothetical protein
MTAHAVPDREELLQAVVDTLREDLLPGANGRDRYQLQVCVAALQMVQRELALSGELTAAAETLLVETGAPDHATLVAEIRAGLEPNRFVAVVAALRHRVEADLRVVRPDAIGVPRSVSDQAVSGRQ